MRWVPVVLVGCGGSVEGLEAVVVKGAEEGATVEVTVEGGDRDYTLSGEGFALDVHTPTAADLHTLSGRTLTFEREGGRTWRAADENGPAWLVVHQRAGDFVEDWFGAGFATFGEVLATRREGRSRDTYRSVVFATDDGDVELIPGDVVTVPVAGAWWRLGLIGAYEHEDLSNSKCGDDHELLSFEALRVEDEEEPATVERAEGREVARGSGGCG